MRCFLVFTFCDQERYLQKETSFSKCCREMSVFPFKIEPHCFFYYYLKIKLTFFKCLKDLTLTALMQSSCYIPIIQISLEAEQLSSRNFAKLLPDCFFNLFPLKPFFHLFLPTFPYRIPHKLAALPASGLSSIFFCDLTWVGFVLPVQLCHGSQTSCRQEFDPQQKGVWKGLWKWLSSNTSFPMLCSDETCLNCHYCYLNSYTDHSTGTVRAILPPGRILNLVVIQPYNDCNSWHSQPAVPVLSFISFSP